MITYWSLFPSSIGALQAWAYQGNARIVDASLSSNFTKIGYSIKDEVQWMNIYFPCPDTR